MFLVFCHREFRQKMGIYWGNTNETFLFDGPLGCQESLEDEELMLKISQKMGGLPSELNPVLQKIEETPMTIHEAAKRGDLAKVQSFLEKKKPLDSQAFWDGWMD